MEIVVKAAALGITGSLLALVIKKSNPEMSLLLALAVCIPVAFMGLGLMDELAEFARETARATNVDQAVMSPMLKCVGLGIVTKLASELCRDAGQSAVASSVELAGTAAALYVSLPLIRTLFCMIEELA